MEVVPALILMLAAAVADEGRAAARCVSMDGPISTEQFKIILATVATGWNTGDASGAASCFAEDAIYIEPPQKQIYRGRQELFEFFGGDAGRPGSMSMIWRTVTFDVPAQTGAAEFSFTYGSTVHGVALIRIEDGLISAWREYWKESTLDWDAFIAPQKN